MENKTLAILNQDMITANQEDVWDFLFMILEQYFKTIEEDKSGTIMQDFNDDQHTLMAFNSLYGQVVNGGFIQLIQNGYGAYIFDNPFSEHLRNWGAPEIANIVDAAKVIYNEHKAYLEKETSIEEFSKMYEEFKQFESLDDKFYEVMDEETENIKLYVNNNLQQFAIITL